MKRVAEGELDAIDYFDVDDELDRSPSEMTIFFTWQSVENINFGWSSC